MHKDGIDGIPTYFDRTKLTPLCLYAIAWWDETHKKCTIGGQGAGLIDSYYKFPRDANGKIDLENGKYSEEEKVILQVKFENEVRLCLGVAVLMDQKGNKKGIRLEAYDYTGKMLLSIKDFQAKIASEIYRVEICL